MEYLNSKLNQLKQKLSDGQKEDSILRNQIKCALNAIFCQSDNSGIICDFCVKNGNLILKTKNKTFANELFLRKTQLSDAFAGNPKIKEITIH